MNSHLEKKNINNFHSDNIAHLLYADNYNYIDVSGAPLNIIYKTHFLWDFIKS